MAKARRKKKRDMVNLVIEILDARQRALAEQQADDEACMATGYVRGMAKRYGYTASFADKLMRRGFAPRAIAVLFRDASRLPVQ
jgi:hypothetical protein